jgi:hypothetical protein
VSTTTKFTQPALVGGTVLGVLSALPIVSAGNICCCLWVISGGVVAAYFLQQGDAAPITTGDGALVGLFAGVVGAFIYLALAIPITILIAPMEQAFMEGLRQRIFDNMGGNMPAGFGGGLPGYIGQGIGLVISFLFMLFVGSMFSTLGGLLGAAIFRRRPPIQSGTPGAPTVIDVTPPQ